MRDFYELLGIAPSASVAEVRQAYARLARNAHPDRYTDAAEKQRAADEFRDITTAFNTLVNPRSREEYDSARLQPAALTPAEQAAEAYARAQEHAEAGRLDEAVRGLRVAAHHAPDDARYCAALGRVLARRPAGVREAIQQLERATALAPHDVAALADLAGLLAGQGLRIRARKVLDAALRMAPGEPRLARLSAELDGLDS